MKRNMQGRPKKRLSFYDELEKGIAKYTETDRRRAEITVQGTVKANEELMRLSGTYKDQITLIDIEKQATIDKLEYEKAATPEVIALINKVAEARKSAIDPMNKFPFIGVVGDQSLDPNGPYGILGD